MRIDPRADAYAFLVLTKNEIASAESLTGKVQEAARERYELAAQRYARGDLSGAARDADVALVLAARALLGEDGAGGNTPP
jgi:hypothetical protein